MHCGAGPSGGTAPYSYQWAITQGSAGVVNNNRSFTSGSCLYGKDFVIKVTVTDAANASVTNSATNFCDPAGP